MGNAYYGDDAASNMPIAPRLIVPPAARDVTDTTSKHEPSTSASGRSAPSEPLSRDTESSNTRPGDVASTPALRVREDELPAMPLVDSSAISTQPVVPPVSPRMPAVMRRDDSEFGSDNSGSDSSSDDDSDDNSDAEHERALDQAAAAAPVEVNVNYEIEFNTAVRETKLTTDINGLLSEDEALAAALVESLRDSTNVGVTQS